MRSTLNFSVLIGQGHLHSSLQRTGPGGLQSTHWAPGTGLSTPHPLVQTGTTGEKASVSFSTNWTLAVADPKGSACLESLQTLVLYQ